MYFKIVSAIVAFALSTSVFAAPVPNIERSFDGAYNVVAREDGLFTRAISAQFTFVGDLAGPQIPAALPATASAKDQKKNQAKITKAQAGQKAIIPKQEAAAARVQAVLDAAQGPLNLPASLPVQIVNDFHPSPSDSISHATFKFTAPGQCSTGCVGHAYQASEATVGKIFIHGVNGAIFGRDFKDFEDLLARDELIARSVNAKFTFVGDLAGPTIPAALPDTASAKEQKKNQAKITKAQAGQKAIIPNQAAAAARVQALLNAAQGPLNLPASLPVQIVNDFHTSASDSINHATFKFTAPGQCATGCVGHAYQAGQATLGKIFIDGVNGDIFGRDFEDFEEIVQ